MNPMMKSFLSVVIGFLSLFLMRLTADQTCICGHFSMYALPPGLAAPLISIIGSRWNRDSLFLRVTNVGSLSLLGWIITNLLFNPH